MAANEKLHLDFENNVVFYEVDKAKELLPMTEEELQAINEANDKFITDVIEAELFRNFNMCSCSTNEVMMRHIRRCSLLGKSPDQVPITLEQSDIDNYHYIIIVICENRKNLGVSTIIRECKKCHRWEIQGDSGIFGLMLADITKNFISAKTIEEDNENEVNEILKPEVEDVDFDDFMRDVLGAERPDDDFICETVNPSEPEIETEE